MPRIVEENHLLKEFTSAKALIDHANKVAHLIDNSKMFVKRITENDGQQPNRLVNRFVMQVTGEPRWRKNPIVVCAFREMNLQAIADINPTAKIAVRTVEQV